MYMLHLSMRFPVVTGDGISPFVVQVLYLDCHLLMATYTQYLCEHLVINKFLANFPASVKDK